MPGRSLRTVRMWLQGVREHKVFYYDFPRQHRMRKYPITPFSETPALENVDPEQARVAVRSARLSLFMEPLVRGRFRVSWITFTVEKREISDDESTVAMYGVCKSFEPGRP